VQLAHVEFSRARRSRVDRAHAASASRTASGSRRRGRARFRRATPRPATRRPATADARRVWNRRVTTTRSSPFLVRAGRRVKVVRRVSPSVARVVSSAREPRGPHNTGHMPAGPFASSVGVGRAEPEWAALNKVTGVCGEGTRA
jgi:hypothetical protein